MRRNFWKLKDVFLPKIIKKDCLINEFDLKFAIITLGEKGAVASQDHFFLILLKKLKIKSTVGAGDAFTAATVMGWLNKIRWIKLFKKPLI